MHNVRAGYTACFFVWTRKYKIKLRTVAQGARAVQKLFKAKLFKNFLISS